jgi:hypothetical protein
MVGFQTRLLLVLRSMLKSQAGLEAENLNLRHLISSDVWFVTSATLFIRC